MTSLTSTIFTVYSVINVGSITGKYTILGISNKPTYTLIATNKVLNDCSYSAAITPSSNVYVNTDYYLPIPSIYRTGIYSVILQNKYTGSITPEYSNSIDISVNLPNDVSFQTVTSTDTTITVPYKITSFDISNVVYTAYVKNTQFDLSANATYTLVNSTNYGAVTTYNTGTFTFSNLLANTGNYYYYFINSNGIRYPTTDSTNIIPLQSVTNTVALSSVSNTSIDSITATYNISYLTYNPTYKLIATNTWPGITDCSYVGSIIPTATGNNYSNLSISNIKRSGNYNVVLKNIYNNGIIETASATKNILVNITNVVSTSGVTSDVSSITIPVTITSYDISNVTYTINIQNISFTSLQSSQTYTLNNTNNYTSPNSYSGTFTFKNLLANTGNYKYYITNTNGVSYPETTILLKTATNTIALNNVSAANSDVSGSITANYSILYLTHTPIYNLIATNNSIGTVTDCIYTVNITNVPTAYPYTIPTTYSLSISNIKRSGNYSVVLKNTYNDNGNIEYSATKNISVNIPNAVSYGTVTSDVSSITIPFTIYSYDISNVVYNLKIQDISFADLSANSPDYIVTNSTNYTSANIFTGSFTFTNLLANTGNYYYYMTNKTTGVKYPAINSDETNRISLTPVANTIKLISLSTTTDTSGSITAKYDISYVSYAPKYKITAQHTHISAADCSYTNTTTIGLPSSYTNRINPYSIDISNIYRSGTYRVYLQNISGTIEQTSTLDISVNIPNDVSFIKVTDTSYSIDISFQITTYDISLVNYKLYIQNTKTTEASANMTYPIYPSRDYTRATTTNIYHSVFTGLTVSGNYNFYMIDACNNRYNGSSIYLEGNGE